MKYSELVLFSTIIQNQAIQLWAMADMYKFAQLLTNKEELQEALEQRANTLTDAYTDTYRISRVLLNELYKEEKELDHE